MSSRAENISEQLKQIAEKIDSRGLSSLCKKNFIHYFEKLASGETGRISDDAIVPLDSLPDLEKLEISSQAGSKVLAKTLVIKLNGGLGTSMGLERAKSLLPAKDGMSFLEIVARQTLSLRSTYGVSLPLLLMNSFNTEEDSLEELDKISGLRSGQGEIPLSFMQNQVPKISKDTLFPATCPENESLEWCPPGHGDIYTALVQDGLLDRLIEAGYEYAFISNIDNLGAVLDLNLLGYFSESGAPFLMEVATRTEADKKGGHLARDKKSGGLLLREVAQCPPEELASFQNTEKYSYFNTNSVWLRLSALQYLMKSNDGILDLPLIKNEKNLDPRDPNSAKVYQLETAFGAAISVFKDATAIRVPRTRFAPVKTTNDLLALWSDNFLLTKEMQVIKNPKRKHGTIVIDLDPKHYKLIDDFAERFPQGAPSLVDCRSLHVVGDYLFGKGIVMRGEVELENREGEQQIIEDGAEL